MCASKAVLAGVTPGSAFGGVPSGRNCGALTHLPSCYLRHVIPRRSQSSHWDRPAAPNCRGANSVQLNRCQQRQQERSASARDACKCTGRDGTAVPATKSESRFGTPEITAAAVALAVLLTDLHQGRLVPGGGPLCLPLAASMASTAIAGAACVPALQRLKARQVVRYDGPKTHVSKAGTPTAGGAFFIPCGVIAGVLFSGAHPAVLAAALGTLALAGIGLRDDMLKIYQRSSKGISGRWKLQLQVLVSLGVCAAAHFLAQAANLPACVGSTLQLVVLTVPLGALPYWGLSVFTIVAESNAVNLTDGLDGLAACTSAIALAAMAICLVPTSRPLATFAAAMAGAAAGFLPYNRHVARCFMGDTGSLALGGALGFTGCLSGAFVPLAIATAVFAAEAASVILQVGWFKHTKAKTGQGRRLLRMAPLHHHFELLGWHETQVTSSFTICAALAAAAAVIVSKSVA